MFSEDLIEHIVSETNWFAQECIAAKPDTEWHGMTLEEMKAFLRVHLLFGIKQLPANHLYWSSDPLICVSSVEKVMSKNHFDKLSQYFHLNTNTRQVLQEDSRHDKLFKVRSILDHVVENCRDTMTREKFVCGRSHG